MTREFRLVLAFLFGVVLVSFPMLALAEDYGAVKWGCGRIPDLGAGRYWGGGPGQWGQDTVAGATGVFGTADQACQGYTGGHTASSFTSQSGGLFTRRCRRENGTDMDKFVSQCWRCPSGGTLNSTTGVCVNAPPCPEGHTRNEDGICVAPPTGCTAGEMWSDMAGWVDFRPMVPSWLRGDGGVVPSSVCAGGCQATLEVEFAGWGGPSGWFAQAWLTATGAECGGSGSADIEVEPEIPEGPEFQCAKAGLGFGTVNGSVVCTAAPEYVEKTESSTTIDNVTGEKTVTTTTSTTNTVTNSTTSTTTTTHYDSGGQQTGQSSSTSTTSGGEEGGVGRLSYSNSALPGVPDFYEQRYPGGLSGVWAARRAELAATPLFGAVGALTSGAPSSGSCPSWSFDFTGLGLGVRILEPPCEIWPVLRVVVMLTALFLARRLVFGG